MDLPGRLLVVPPSRRPHTHTVIFLHGRGDTASNLVEGLHQFSDARSRSLFELFPSFRWVFPQAALRDVACTGDKTYQWFDVWDMRDPTDREELQREGLTASVARVRGLLREEAALLGGRWDALVLAGISQGGATAVHTMMSLGESEAIGAVIGFSCGLPFARDSLAETRAEAGTEGAGWDGVVRATPVMLEHCEDDPLVTIDRGRKLRDKLTEWGGEVTWREYPHGGHWFNMSSGPEDAAQFLRQVFKLGKDGNALAG